MGRSPATVLPSRHIPQNWQCTGYWEGGYFSPLSQRNLCSSTYRCSPTSVMPLYEDCSSFFSILDKRDKGKMAVCVGRRENWGTVAALTLSRLLGPRYEWICKVQQSALKIQQPHCVFHVFYFGLALVWYCVLNASGWWARVGCSWLTSQRKLIGTCQNHSTQVQ